MNDRYLFNVGEGLQRFMMEHKVKMSKICSVFFTTLDTDTVGGFPGMLLTLSDIGTKELSIIGPKNTTSYLYSLRHFIKR
jgi:ribonuclease Z